MKNDAPHDWTWQTRENRWPREGEGETRKRMHARFLGGIADYFSFSRLLVSFVAIFHLRLDEQRTNRISSLTHAKINHHNAKNFLICTPARLARRRRRRQVIHAAGSLVLYTTVAQLPLLILGIQRCRSRHSLASLPIWYRAHAERPTFRFDAE